jgi:hypothetical protein
MFTSPESVPGPPRQRIRHGQSRDPLYVRWQDMMARCRRPSHHAFARYGGRGIIVCPAWHDYRVWRRWIDDHGYAPGLGLEVDRVDNDGPYSPENCRLVHRSKQSRNKSNSVYLTAWGQTCLLVDWLTDPRCRVRESTLRARVRRGWSHADALSRPVKQAKA